MQLWLHLSYAAAENERETFQTRQVLSESFKPKSLWVKILKTFGSVSTEKKLSPSSEIALFLIKTIIQSGKLSSVLQNCFNS